VADLYRLRRHERALVQDMLVRGRTTLLGTVAARHYDVDAPEPELMLGYAGAVCRTVNAVLRIEGRRHLVADITPGIAIGDDRLDRFATVRFRTVTGRAPSEVVSRMASDEAGIFLHELRHQLIRSPTPYLRERRSLRVYNGTQVTVIKPAQRRYWPIAAGLQDGDAILADHPPGRS
jgi:hypothetical protein